MAIDELLLGVRAYGVLKKAGIDTVEDLCRFTPEQLPHLGNFGQKSLDEVEQVLKERSLSLHRGPTDPRLLVSSIEVGPRLNLAFSVSSRDRASLAKYTVRELVQIEDSLVQVTSQLSGQQRRRLLIINGHLGLRRSVHETILPEGPRPSEAEAPQSPQ
jgi:predicted RecB family nuclease